MFQGALLSTVAALLFPLTSICGQVVRGAVVDPGDVPVPGVVVTLLDSAGTEAARALTSDRGDFRLQAPSAGTYRLRAVRIGFRPTVSDPFPVSAGAEVVRRIALANIPLALAAVRVEGRGSCRVAGDSASAMFAALEQARAALAATEISTGTRTLAITTLAYTRTLDAATPSRVLDQTATVSREFVRQPWRTIAVESARRVGYVAVDPDGATTYSAPGIDGLGSRSFLADYCFRVAPGSDRSTLGIAFSPTPARLRTRLPELQGTVWLDRTTAELRLRSMPGIKVFEGLGNRAYVASGRGVKSLLKPCTSEVRELEGRSGLEGGKCECVADVYLDGVIVSKTVVPDINRFRIDQLEAVEYYAGPAETPPEYAGLGSPCGVLVLWTRRSP